MQKFSSIDQFRHVVGSVRRINTVHGVPLTKETFEGTVKLHGSNGGVRVKPHKLIPQSRERIVSIGSDNAGFAQFVHGREDMFHRLAGMIGAMHGVNGEDRYTIYGEWCGGNIQKKVALNSVNRHFVVFNVFDHETERYINREWMDFIVNESNDENLLKEFNDADIYFIYQVKPFIIEIDFSQPEQIVPELERLTLEVEERCPWGTFRGVEGIGEGIVWALSRDVGNPDYWFKTKGVKHQGKDGGKTNTPNVDPVRIGAIRELAESIAPIWRLEQGITWMTENNMEFTNRNVGQYIQWVCKDTIKEESDTIAANDFDWKELSKYVTQRAKDFYFKHLNEIAFSGA